MDEGRWAVIDAVASSPLLHGPSIPNGIDLAEVERALFDADELEAARRERLLRAAHELAEAYVDLA